jgi:hypothetical protein
MPLDIALPAGDAELRGVTIWRDTLRVRMPAMKRPLGQRFHRQTDPSGAGAT